MPLNCSPGGAKTKDRWKLSTIKYKFQYNLINLTLVQKSQPQKLLISFALRIPGIYLNPYLPHLSFLLMFSLPSFFCFMVCCVWALFFFSIIITNFCSFLCFAKKIKKNQQQQQRLANKYLLHGLFNPLTFKDQQTKEYREPADDDIVSMTVHWHFTINTKTFLIIKSEKVRKRFATKQ